MLEWQYKEIRVGIHNFIANTKKTTNRNRGFTMVEIVIVVVVIGILAGITIVSYGSWRKNIAEGQVKSDLSGVASAMEGARNFGSTYPTSLPTNFKPSTTTNFSFSRFFFRCRLLIHFIFWSEIFSNLIIVIFVLGHETSSEFTKYCDYPSVCFNSLWFNTKCSNR